MRINHQKEYLLLQLKLDMGLPEFKTTLGKILLPPDQRQHPDPKFILKANQFRQIPGA